MHIERIIRKLSYANVMSTIAVFGVLAGGGAYAASKVGSQQIKENAVRSKHIKDRSIHAQDLSQPSVITVASFVNGWESYDNGTVNPSDDAPVRIWKDLSGVVHFEGAVSKAGPVGDGSIMFSISDANRPAANYLSFPVVTTSTDDSDEQLGFVYVQGNYVYFNGGNSEDVSLDGITYRAAE